MTTTLRLKEITTGDEDGTWGDSTNTNLELIADGFSYGTKEMAADANETFTMPDFSADATRSLYLKITSAVSLTATREVTLGPNTVSKTWIIENATSGSQIITIKQGSGATVNVPNGSKVMVVTDGAGAGAAVFNANPTEVGGTVTSIDVSGGTTGLTTSGGPVTTSGTITLAGTLAVANGGTGVTSSTGTGSVVLSIRAGMFYTHSTDQMSFRVASQTRVSIASSGNVGIGTASPNSTASAGPTLEISGTAGGNLVLSDSNATSGQRAKYIISQGGELYVGHSADDGTSPVNDLVIDSSGNVGIGTNNPVISSGYTSLTLNNATNSGYLVLQNNGTTKMDMYVSGGSVPTLRSISSALSLQAGGANVITFTTNASERVGSIGIESNGFYIDGESAHAGIKFTGNAVIPRDNGVDVDSLNDIGASAGRWKDLYLSGGVYLGGTGAANKLDDYEEGTWTPAFSASTTAPTITYTSQAGTYVKVGEYVYCEFVLILSSFSGGSGHITFTGLPFATQDNDIRAGMCVSFSAAFANGCNGMLINGGSTTSGVLRRLDATNNVSAVIDVSELNGNEILRGSISYKSA
jgi:hypothetical protein